MNRIGQLKLMTLNTPPHPEVCFLPEPESLAFQSHIDQGLRTWKSGTATKYNASNDARYRPHCCSSFYMPLLDSRSAVKWIWQEIVAPSRAFPCLIPFNKRVTPKVWQVQAPCVYRVNSLQFRCIQWHPTPTSLRVHLHHLGAFRPPGRDDPRIRERTSSRYAREGRERCCETAKLARPKWHLLSTTADKARPRSADK